MLVAGCWMLAVGYVVHFCGDSLKLAAVGLAALLFPPFSLTFFFPSTVVASPWSHVTASSIFVVV